MSFVVRAPQRCSYHYISWLATINHNLQFPAPDVQESILPLVNHPVKRGATIINYVRLGLLNQHEGSLDWSLNGALSPFRFLPFSGQPSAAIRSTWSAVRVLDLSQLTGNAVFDASLASQLPPLPSLRYVILPNCDDRGEVVEYDEPFESEADDMFEWLSRCPRLTMLDDHSFHWLWPETCNWMCELEIPSRLVLIDRGDAQTTDETVLDDMACLHHCFALSSTFGCLAYFALSIGVTRGGLVAFPLWRLAGLPVLHTLHLAIRFAAGYKRTPWSPKSDEDPVLTQLRTIRTLRRLEVNGSAKLFEGATRYTPVPRATRLLVIGAVFGRTSSTAPAQSGDDEKASESSLSVTSLRVRLPAYESTDVEAVKA